MRDQEQKFREYIHRSYTKCIAAKSAIVKASDKIHLYSLLIATGFIYNSNYGQNYIDGLKYIYDTLKRLNNDPKIKKDLCGAIKSTTTSLLSYNMWPHYEKLTEIGFHSLAPKRWSVRKMSCDRSFDMIIKNLGHGN